MTTARFRLPSSRRQSVRPAAWLLPALLLGIGLRDALCRPAAAQDLVLTFTPSVLSVAPGGSIAFRGTIQNNSPSVVYLTGIGQTLPNTGFDFDGDLFFSNAPVSLASGASTDPLALFTITAHADAAPGDYFGNFVNILGGAYTNAQFVEGSQDYSVNVSSDASAAPEPSEWAALGFVGTGLVGLRLRARRTRPLSE